MNQKLNKGDSVAIIATAKKIKAEELKFAITYLESLGLNVQLGKNLYAEDRQFAGSDKLRAEDLQWAINSKEIKAIFCARGGYGTLRIIDQIDFSPLKNNHKWIFGYSDITSLHNHLLAKHSIASVHGTMPINMAENTEDALNSIKTILEGEKLNYTIPTHPLSRNGNASGILFGGNLSLLQALNGSSSIPNPESKILFIEDLDEYLYHIDRMMLNLKRSGILDGISGLIVGAFTEMKDNPIPFGKTAYEIIAEHTASYSYPVCFNFPAGHVKDNRAVIIGANCKINVKAEESVFTQ